VKSKTKITYYDFTKLTYSSYFLAGFCQNKVKYGYEFISSRSSPALFPDLAANFELTRALGCILLFKIETGGREYYFCIDALDGNKYFNIPLLSSVAFYFKVNYNQKEIANNPDLSGYRDKIFPAGLFFPVRAGCWGAYLPRLLSNLVRGGGALEFVSSLKMLVSLVGIEDFFRLRKHAKCDLDIFFVTRFYDEPVHNANMEFRFRLIRAIKECKGLRAITGFAYSKEIYGKFAEYAVEEYNSGDYLNNMARAKVALYIRGAHDCLSFKLGQILALGKPIVGQTIINSIDMYYGRGRISEQFAYEDPEEMVREAVRLLENRSRMEELGRENARMFDDYFTPARCVAAMLDRLL